MPELPEVETVARALDILVSGRTISHAGVYREKLIPQLSSTKFEQAFNYAGIRGVTRRGKFILFDLDNSKTLLAHLRMSGVFQVFQPDHENPKFTHAEFFLDNGSRLVFSDQRHFGYMNVVESVDLPRTKELKELAPEPFSEEFSFDYLFSTLRSTSRKVKELLLDQKKVCGLGNIYVSEALFLSRIHPETASNKVSRIKSNRLRDNIRGVFTNSLNHGNGKPVDPLNLESRYFGGEFEGEWLVYDKENQPCTSCGHRIKRLMQAGRSSYFCGNCQRKKTPNFST